MTWLRRLALLLTITLIVAIAFVWFNQPTIKDMAQNAPADSLVYLEANNVIKISDSIANTKAWQQLSPLLNLKRGASWNTLGRFMAWSGLGPVRSVVALRAQVAVVMLNVGTTEEGDSLKVKPDAAFIIETHTASWRIKSATEELVSELAKSIYKSPTFTKHTNNGSELMVWRDSSQSRQIIATVDDSVVIIANSEAAINTCLAVRRGQRPNLSTDPEFAQVRRNLGGDQALAFGYVSSTNAARLVTLATPMMLGRASTELPIEGVVNRAAEKLLGSIGWASSAAADGIEDRYHFTLPNMVLERLRPSFRSTTTNDSAVEGLLDDTYSTTLYRFESPEEAWKGLESAVLSQLDALSAAVFRSVLKSSLMSYGIEEPERFLPLVGPNIATLRLSPLAERSVLVASIKDRERLRALVRERLQGTVRTNETGSIEILESEDQNIAAAFAGPHVLLGPPGDVRSAAEALTTPATQQPERLRLRQSKANSTIVTYTNDTERVRNFVKTLARAFGRDQSGVSTEALDRAVANLPDSLTETNLGNEGLERRTVSAFGQFSSIVDLVFSAQSER